MSSIKILAITPWRANVRQYHVICQDKLLVFVITLHALLRVIGPTQEYWRGPAVKGQGM
jgi:hypothetical protein